MEERVQLDKTFKQHWVWAIALGSAIGWGAFILPTEWMAKAGPLGVITGLFIGGLIMMVIAVSYGILINKFPVSGGGFTYAYLGFGRTHAYFCGWFLTLGYICIVALNASAMALLGKFLFPSITNTMFLYEINGWEVYLGEVLIASAALIFFAWFNIKGASLSGQLQFIFCVILVLGIIFLTAGMLLHPDFNFSYMTPAFKPGIAPITGIIAILAVAPWAFVGFDNIPQAAEEFNFPAKKAFSLIIYSILVAIFLYAFMVIATAAGGSWQQLVAGKPIWGTGDVVSQSLGTIGVVCLAISVCMGIFTGLNGFYVSASRLMFAMGRAQILPAAFTKLHSKHKTPHNGIIFTCILCLIAPWFGRPVLLWIVDMSAIGVTIAYLYTCLTAFKQFVWRFESGYSKGGAGAQGKDERTVSPVKKLICLLGVLSSVAFLALLLVPGSPSALGTPSLIALAAWVLMGIAFYMYKAKDFQKVSKETLDYYILGKERPAENNRTEDEALAEFKLDASK
ncbi:APC family permease [Bacillus sp. B190/17]|uniref:APC family permease n=1 Tax=Bacillus lumedeiriae TaxID=3058829 RepID=A0ABW8I6J5_9BACI